MYFRRSVTYHLNNNVAVDNPDQRLTEECVTPALCA
jgi:ABC-type uncharacterized transport system fused permease/ATPase subunit